MARAVSLDARRSLDRPDDDFQLVLLQIEHPDYAAPLRLSSDPTERLSDDPLLYGTRSTFAGADPETEPFVYAAMQLELPGDLTDAPTAMRIEFLAVTPDLTAVLRSVRTRPTLRAALVMASAPSVIEQEWRGLQVLAAPISAAAVSVEISRRPIEEEFAVPETMGRQRFPGLFR